MKTKTIIGNPETKLRTIKQVIFIDSAHQLKDSEDLVTKKCCNLHGHTYKITVEFNGYPNQNSGLLCDFSCIKQIVNQLDHQFINDIFEQDKKWAGKNTTAENIAKFIAKKVKELSQIKSIKVSVVEGYKGEEHSPVVTYED